MTIHKEYKWGGERGEVGRESISIISQTFGMTEGLDKLPREGSVGLNKKRNI